MPYNNIAVIGGGAWGTALAHVIALNGLNVRIWAHEAETVREIREHRTNSVFLPGIALAQNLEVTGNFSELAESDLCLLVPPAQHLGRIAAALRDHIPAATPWVICSKGIEQSSGRLLGEVLSEAVPGAVIAALSGPSFASDVARGLPAALTVACNDETIGEEIARSLGSRNLRLYWTNDVIGVQLGGAIKNVLAIAAGIVEGRQLGASAHAALVTRGFAEMHRFAKAFGARPQTMAGLAGLGDLLLTCGSPQSRNMSLGRSLGQGQSLDDILGKRRAVTEGVFTAAAMSRVADDKSIDVPIARAVHAIVEGRIDVDDAIKDLMTRPIKPENDITF
ncbi:MAG: NAD(P)-dependent glycerol-3-phosphate dehydrogenase [Alphaproteobacteria bacterium]|nr:NAD(P)-dependent glycerol-3-phosphate dehydrogenase [Alphaproteobacteria bacterium]